MRVTKVEQQLAQITTLRRGFVRGPGGVQAYVKGPSPTGRGDVRSARHERAAYIVARLLGWRDLVPPTVLLSPTYSAQKRVDGLAPYGASMPTQLRLFDYLIANGDRHSGNWFPRRGGKAWAIDNAFSFFQQVLPCPPLVPDEATRERLCYLVAKPEKVRQELQELLSYGVTTALLRRMRHLSKA